MSMEKFAEYLQPLAHSLKDIPLDDNASAKDRIEKALLFSGELIAMIREHALFGMKEGWLLTKEVGGIRLGRVTKDLEGFSVDAVYMNGPGPKHRHPNGEIDLCFATEGDAKFDGNAEGWVVYEPDSVHVPTVSDGRMLILYFLPGGAFEMLG